MPNWCHNTLWVSGSADEVAAFIDHSKTDEAPLSFEADVPIPEDDDSPYAFIDRWGTKWDASFGQYGFFALGADEADVDVSMTSLGAVVTENAVVYKFETAWSPPLSWLEAAAECWPGLSFRLRWAEVGMAVAGETTIAGGVEESFDLAVEDVLSPEEMWF